MSRVIEHGTEAGHHRDNWNGKQVRCPSCGCLFEITPKSDGRISKISRTNYKMRVRCPECLMTTPQVTFY